MHAEHFFVNDCGKRQIIKQVCELLPDGQATVLALAFYLEAIYLSNLARFVISAKQMESCRVAQF